MSRREKIPSGKGGVTSWPIVLVHGSVDFEIGWSIEWAISRCLEEIIGGVKRSLEKRISERVRRAFKLFLLTQSKRLIAGKIPM